MADHADGSVIVDTDMDTSGFKAGSTELKSAIRSLNSKVEGLGPTFQKAMSGNAKAMGTFEDKASGLKNKIAELESKMETLGNKRLPTEDYKYFGAELIKAKNHLAQLDDREAKMRATGVNRKSSAYKNLQYDIELTKEKILDLEATMEGMRQNGTAFQLGTATPEYQQLAEAIAAAKRKLEEMEAASGSSNLPANAERVADAFSRVGSFIKSSVIPGLKRAAGVVKKLLSNTLKLVTGMGKLGNSTNKTSSMMGRMIKRMIFMYAIRSVLTSVKEGIDALAKSSSDFNNTMSQLKTSTAQLKNALGSAFATILSVIVPILSLLISKLATAINLIGQFFAALTGASSYKKLVTQQQDYAGALDATAGAAKEAKRQLAGFDELNVLSDTGGGGGGGGAGAGTMLEEVPIDSAIADFVNKIKEAFTNGQYAEIGKIIGEKINDVFTSIENFINWDNVGGAITKFVTAVADGFNALVDVVNWEGIGNTFAQGLNTVVKTLYLVFTEFDWLGLAKGLTNSLNGFIKNVDWAAVGQTISAYFVVALQFILTALETFDWQAFGSAVATLLANIDWSELRKTVAKIVGEIFDGILDFRRTLHEELPEDLRGMLQLAEAIGLAIAAWKISSTLLWGINSIMRLPPSIVIGVQLAITGITIEAKGIVDAIKTGLNKSNFASIVSGGLLTGAGASSIGLGIAGAVGAALGAGIGGVIAGLPAMFVGIYDACVNGIDWLNAALTGASATAAGAGIGAIIGACGGPIGAGIGALIGLAVGLVTDGIILVVQKWDVITEFLRNFFTVTVPNIWNSFVVWLKNIPNALSEFFSSIPGRISAWFSDMWQPIKDFDWNGLGNDIGSGLGNAIKNAIHFVTVSVPTFFAELWVSIKTAFVTFFTETLPTAFQAFVDFVKGFPQMLWNAIKAGWNWLVSIGKAIIEGIWEGLKTIGKAIADFVTGFVQGVKDKLGIHSPSTVFAGIGSSIVAGLLQGLTQTWRNITAFFSTALSPITSAMSDIKSALSSGWSSIKSTASSTWSSIKSTLSSTWKSIKSTCSSTMSSIKSALSSGWNGNKKTISSTISSIKSALSSGWRSIKSDCSSAMSSIKSDLSSGWSNIKSTMSSTWSSIKSTLSSSLSTIKTNMTNTFSTLKTNASTWGKHICENIANGISNSLYKVADAAKKIANKIKSFLGFSEPEDGPLSNFHTYMPDMVDLMVKGMKENQGRAGTAAAGIAQAIADEVQNGDYSVADIMPEGEVNSTLYNFTDKIANSFSELMDRLQSIANSVTFTTPDVVSGAVPYSVAAQASSKGSSGSGSDHDDISSVVIQSVNNATVAIVKAIQENCNTNVTVDAESLTDSIINEINRRTRMNGKSPLLT